MENDIKIILEKLTGLETQVSGIQTQLNTFEQKVDNNFDDVSESIAGVMALATERFDRIENEHVRRLENLELSSVDLRRDITKLKAHTGIE
jgi:hypothetical protein